MGNEIWVCGRVWDIDLTIRLAGLSLSQYSQIPRPGVTDLVTTHLSFSGVAAPGTECDPSCVCLTGDCDNHCIVSLVMIITNQSPQLRGVSPLLSCAWSPRHLLPWSRAPDSSSSYVIRWTQCCHNSDCLSFKSPVTARRVPTPRHILSVHTWYLPIVKLFTTPTREGFYKINSQPHDDLPGCRNSDTLILPQKEFSVGNDICVSRGVNIMIWRQTSSHPVGILSRSKSKQSFSVTLQMPEITPGAAWLLFICSSAGQALHCCEHCSVCRVMRLMRHIAGLMTRVRSDMGAIYTALLRPAARPAAK